MAVVDGKSLGCTSFLPIACSHSLAIHHVLTRHFPPMCARTLSLLHTHVSHTRITHTYQQRRRVPCGQGRRVQCGADRRRHRPDGQPQGRLISAVLWYWSSCGEVLCVFCRFRLDAHVRYEHDLCCTGRGVIVLKNYVIDAHVCMGVGVWLHVYGCTTDPRAWEAILTNTCTPDTRIYTVHSLTTNSTFDVSSDFAGCWCYLVAPPPPTP